MQISTLDYNLYKQFIAVFEHKNMTKAAEKFFCTAAAIGQRIKELEILLGVELFTRHSRGVEPTSDAIELYPIIKSAVDQMFLVEQNIQTFTSESKATIKMAISSTVAIYFLSDYMKEFCKDYPNVQFKFIKKQEGLEQLIQRKIDFMIDFDYFFQQDNFKTHELLKMQNVAFCSNKLLSEKKITTTLTKDEFLQQRFIGSGHFLNNIANKTGLPIHPIMDIDRTDIIIAMIANGLGVGIHFDKVVDKLVDSNITRINVVDLEFPPVTYVCAYIGQLTKAARIFVDGLIKFCKKL